MCRLRFIAMLLFSATPAIAAAAETVTYSYDAKGRLVQVSHAGGAANGVNAAYSYDAADNRTQHSVAGASPTSPVNPLPIIVVPLNGLQAIVLDPDI